MLLILALLTVLSSAWLTQVTIASARRLQLGVDEGLGVQKFHSHWVPRLGGVPIFVAAVSSILGAAWATGTEIDTSVAFIVCVLPAFGIGLIEDVTRRAGVLVRLVFTMISAALGWWLLDARLVRLDIPYVDMILGSYWIAAFALTLVAVAGIAHAVNIIDGYNGLSGVYALIAFCSLAVVGVQVGDGLVVVLSVLLAAAVAGFLLWNFPFGRIFLGDSGAYLIGFALGEISVLLVARNSEVSAWFPMLIAIYPVWETLFSMYRKKVLRGMSPGQPDGLHFHMLVYKRLVKRRIGADLHRRKLIRNASTSPYLWVLTLMSAMPALMFWRERDILIAFCLLFIVTYLWIYWRIVRFRAPAMFVLRPPETKPPQSDAEPG